MENRAAKRRAKGGDDDVVDSNRISRLPESVLLHILCFLSHKKAVQTSVLSKSWRHLGPTRPVIHIREDCGAYLHRRLIGVCENCFYGNNEAFESALDETFQRYHDLNLPAHELHLEMSKSISVLQKWIPIFMNPDKPPVTTFRLSFDTWQYFVPPRELLKSEYLLELRLHMCRLDKNYQIDNVMLKSLRKLSLSRVEIADETLVKIISGCPLVKRVVLDGCQGFKDVRIADKNRHLNYFEFSPMYGDDTETSIEIDSPTVQIIRIVSCSNWYRSHINYFPNLKSLFLSQVKLPDESFVDFSCNFPRLEELTLKTCYGFEEIKLSSFSMKRLVIQSPSPINRVAVEVPNILYFEFSSSFLPSTTFYLTTTSTEWKSNLNFRHCVYDDGDDVLPRILKLFEMVKGLSQSQLSLSLSETLKFKINQIEWDFNDHPVVVEHLNLDIVKLCTDSLTGFAHYFNALLRIFRPRYIYAYRLNHNDDEEVAELLWKTLTHKREKTEYGWDQHLEEVSIEASDRKRIVWHHVQWNCLPEHSLNQRIRFRLKWRDLVDY